MNAVINWIDGKSHLGDKKTKVPQIFGMNFQVVSVGQKLIEKGVARRLIDACGTPDGSRCLSEIEFVDKSIGNMVLELKKTRPL